MSLSAGSSVFLFFYKLLTCLFFSQRGTFVVTGLGIVLRYEWAEFSTHLFDFIKLRKVDGLYELSLPNASALEEHDAMSGTDICNDH